MNGTGEELLRLEGAKHIALIEGNAPAYDESVRAQLLLLDSSSDLESSARTSPEKLAVLSRLIRHNTSLFLNLLSTSAVVAQNCTSYSPSGDLSLSAGFERRKIAVEA